MYSFHLDCSLYYFCFRSDDSSHTYLVRLLVQPFCSFRGKVHEHLQGVPGGFIWLSKIRSVRLFPTKPHRLGHCRCSLFVPNSGRLATSSLFKPPRMSFRFRGYISSVFTCTLRDDTMASKSQFT